MAQGNRTGINFSLKSLEKLFGKIEVETFDDGTFTLWFHDDARPLKLPMVMFQMNEAVTANLTAEEHDILVDSFLATMERHIIAMLLMK